MDPYAQYNSGEINEDDGDQNNVAYDEYDRGEEDYNPFKGFSMLKALEKLDNKYEQIERYFMILNDTFSIEHLQRPLGYVYNEVATLALFEACKSNRFYSYQAIRLLEDGANPNYQLPKSFEAPLHWLSRRNNLVVTKLLVQAGADIFLLDSRHRNTLIHACDTSRSDQQPLVKYLLSQKGCKYKLEIRDAGGCSALLCAIFKSNVWIVRELLLAGASVCDKGGVNSSAYNAALWIYCAGMQLDIDQLPSKTLQPTDIVYKLFSLKGHYTKYSLMFLQTLYKYNEELVFRMVQKRHYEEEVYYKPPPLADAPKAPTINPEKIKLYNDEKRRQRKIKKLLKRRDYREEIELENWNMIRKQLALKIDKEFTKHLRGVAADEPHEWVKIEKQKGMDWEVHPSKNKSIYTSPPYKATNIKFKNITVEQQVGQYYNNTHDSIDRLDFTRKTEPVSKYASELNLEHPDKSRKYWKIADDKREPHNLGYYDRNSRWVKLREETILIAPEEIDSDDDLSQYQPKAKSNRVNRELDDKSLSSDDDKCENNNDDDDDDDDRIVRVAPYTPS